ncbi:MAG: helix-turn-helix transcriptional regulator [Firmicutes bacterium]|nr:helix-turn-helix transcriptional regulator [Bacillota bacterium]
MAKNSIGQFIAALRKASGMTQQEVADRLNVSNKAVSRWERDECAPDLSVIPALAEMFGVTCDELLKGERILESNSEEKKEPRVEKQVKCLINQTLFVFKTLIWISLAAAAVGLICMFGISYGFYRPVIGFAVMSLFEACAMVIAVLAVSRTKDVKDKNELFEPADNSLKSRFYNTLGTMSFAAFFVILAVVLLSLPLILNTSDYINSVITPYGYFRFYFGGIVLILALVYLMCKKPYINRIAHDEVLQSTSAPDEKSKRTMNGLQLALTILAGLIFLFAPYLEKPNEGFALFDAAIIVALLCFAASIAVFVVFLIKNKGDRKDFILPGSRNLLMMLPLLLLPHAHSVGWDYFCDKAVSGSEGSESIIYERYDIWNIEFIWYTAALCLVIFLVFKLIDALIKRKSK